MGTFLLKSKSDILERSASPRAKSKRTKAEVERERQEEAEIIGQTLERLLSPS